MAYWQQIREQQKKMIDRIEGHDKVKLLGPNVDLSLSIKGRKFINSTAGTTCRTVKSTPARWKTRSTAG